MKLSEFILLSESEKKMKLINYGMPLAQRRYLEFMVFLFQFESYYVEAYCNTSNKRIEEYRVLPDTDSISDYLQAIPIDELLS